jgi:hypothetical protein
VLTIALSIPMRSANVRLGGRRYLLPLAIGDQPDFALVVDPEYGKITARTSALYLTVTKFIFN